MSAMLHKPATSPLPPNLFTIQEAAWLAEMDQKAVRNEIRKKIVLKADFQSTLLDRCDVSYLRSIRQLHGALGVELRRRICAEIRDALRNSSNPENLTFGAFDLRLASVLKEIDKRISDVQEARTLVHRNQKISNGEPLVVGTRIPVRVLAEIHRSGTSIEELSRQYNLTTRQICLAILYDQLHPKLGRPSADKDLRMSDLGDFDRDEVEELGEFHKS